MKTELRIAPANVIGGAKIDVVEYNLNNYRLHQILEQISRLFLFMLECDSNNTSSKVRPRDVRDIRAQWQIAKEELEFSMNHNDLPGGIYEYGFKIYLIEGKEIQRIRNVKIKRVISELFNCARTILSVDSAKTQTYIDQKDAEAILEMFAVCDACILRWFGEGKDANDVGISSPAFEALGDIYPDVDADFASISEPSKGGVLPKLPDTPDV